MFIFIIYIYDKLSILIILIINYVLVLYCRTLKLNEISITIRYILQLRIVVDNAEHALSLSILCHKITATRFKLDY